MSRVVVIGNAGLDLRLAVPRLPLPGETLIGTEGARAPGGKGLNQAVVAARCGAQVRFCAPLGSDSAQANEVEGWLSREPFDGLILPRLPHPTDFSLLMVLPDGENSIVSTSACSLALGFAAAEPALDDLGVGDVVLLEGNLSLDVTGAILTAARRRGATTIFNPAPFWPGAEKVLAQCSLIIANRLEAKALGASIADAAAAIVTLGADGCRFAGRVFPAERVAAIDTTGCGDAFCGAMAAALVRGLAIEPAIGVAQKAAALTATRAGAFDALPSREELAALFA
jgi:ribokinase